MVNPTEVGAWAVAAKSGIDCLKSAWAILPTGENKDTVGRKIEEAEQALARADAKLAKELGYPLCECTFPPKPMLWKEKIKLFVCDNPDCGRTAHRGPYISDEMLQKAAQKPPYR
jgi:hypothetical protein